MIRRLTCPAPFYELERSLKQWEILFVFGHVGAIDLYPFPRTCQTAGLKRDNIVPRELQLRRRGNRQTQSNAVAANAGEHLVADEVGVKAVDFSCAGAWEREKESVDLRFAIEIRFVGSQRKSIGLLTILSTGCSGPGI